MYSYFFGFSEKPFNVTPDPKFLFLTESHQEALSSMVYGIKERRGFISISGEVGTGKTTLIHHLLDNLDRKVKAVFLYQTRISFEQLLKEILLELELPVAAGDKTSLIRQLNDYLIQMLARDENLAMIIDEAQNLSQEVMEELRLLSNLETSRSKLLQIVFVGQPELEAKLNSVDLRQLKQRIGIRRQIRPLTKEESGKYIEHRLSLVGSSTSKVFSTEAVSLICQYAQGIPRTINILCDNAFLIGYGLTKEKIDANIIREVIRDMDSSALKKPAHREIVISPQPAFHSNYQRLSLASKFGGIEKGRWRIFNKKAFFSILLLLGVALVILLGPKYMNGILYNPEKKPSINQTLVPRSSTQSFPKINPALISNIVPTLIPENKDIPSETHRPIPVSPAPLASAKAESRLKQIIAVEKGGSLSSLATKSYTLSNTTLIDLILEFNPTITNAHLIKEHQKIKIPEITEALLIIQFSDEDYKIHLGTFLKPEDARQFRNEPVLQGKEIEIIPRKVSPKETWYRLVAGRFETREEALKTIQALRGKRLLPILQQKQ